MKGQKETKTGVENKGRNIGVEKVKTHSTNVTTIISPMKDPNEKNKGEKTHQVASALLPASSRSHAASSEQHSTKKHTAPTASPHGTLPDTSHAHARCIKSPQGPSRMTAYIATNWRHT
jgi:hypothetical protein